MAVRLSGITGRPGVKSFNYVSNSGHADSANGANSDNIVTNIRGLLWLKIELFTHQSDLRETAGWAQCSHSNIVWSGRCSQG